MKPRRHALQNVVVDLSGSQCMGNPTVLPGDTLTIPILTLSWPAPPVDGWNMDAWLFNTKSKSAVVACMVGDEGVELADESRHAGMDGIALPQRCGLKIDTLTAASEC